jgi:hypothetical protein
MAPLIRPSGILPQLLILYLISCLPVAIVAFASVRGPSAWLRAVASLFILQDAARYAAYKSNRTLQALISDCLLFVGVLGGVAAGFALSSSDVIWTLTSWIFGCALALIPLRFALKGEMSGRRVWRWWKRVCRRLSLPLLLDSVAYFVSMNVTIYILAGLASPRSWAVSELSTGCTHPWPWCSPASRCGSFRGWRNEDLPTPTALDAWQHSHSR